MPMPVGHGGVGGKAVAVVPEDVVLVSLDGHGTPAWLVGTMTAI
jgi:hypothetical protein